MGEAMLSAKPIQAFHLGGKRVLVCHVAEANPNHFLGKEFLFFTAGRPQGRIKIEGISTAGQTEKGIYDFSYSGDEIRPEQIGGDSLIKQGTSS